MRINRPYWNVIEGDVAKISSLNLTDFFGLKKEILICCLAVHLVKHFLMLEND